MRLHSPITGDSFYIRADVVLLVTPEHSTDIGPFSLLHTDVRFLEAEIKCKESCETVWRLRASELGLYPVADRLNDEQKADYEKLVQD